MSAEKSEREYAVRSALELLKKNGKPFPTDIVYLLPLQILRHTSWLLGLVELYDELQSYIDQCIGISSDRKGVAE